MRNRITRLLSAAAVASLGLSAVSCGGAGSDGAENLVLVSFNLPNIAGVPLNQPLIFQFSDDVDASSVTPDTIQVVGSPSFTFEQIVVDGNLVAELPFIPNFEDYSDSGLAPAKTYSVFLPIFPAVNTVRSVRGRPLVQAESFSFTTNPTAIFIEPRRPLLHTPLAVQGDEDGCVQNQANPLFDSTFQFGADPADQLLCLKNEGAPRVILANSIPTHDQRAVGTPSAVAPGLLDFPAIRVRFNEPLDPISAVPYVPTTRKSINIQLWRVGNINAVPVAPVQIETNKPLVVQDLSQTEVILVPVKAEQQGTYMVNIQGLRDLPGNLVQTSDRPVQPLLNPTDPYAAIDNGLVGTVAPGYRIYFRTLQVPPTAGAISAAFGNAFDERTNQTFTATVGTNPVSPLTTPRTLTQLAPGQATTANWNNDYRFAGLSGLQANTSVDNGAGRLKAVFAPYLGNGSDGAFNLTSGSTTLTSDGGSINGDGVYEYDSFNMDAGTTLSLQGSRPVMILVRNSCTINGTITAAGAPGTFGIDTDGTTNYTNALAIDSGGNGGLGRAGGGNGGLGGPSTSLVGDGTVGSGGANMFAEVASGGGGFGLFGDNTNGGGGGGGFGAAGSNGSGGGGGGGGAAQGSADFLRSLAQFTPDRVFQPNAAIAGGAGGGGGGVEDDNNASETGNTTITVVTGTRRLAGGDDGAGGGGAGGGAVWILAKSILVGSTGQINVNGGAGGNTFGPADQLITDPDNNTTGDEYVAGVVNPNGAGTGQGGGGGGGAGGAILLQGRDAVTVSAGAVLSAQGGAGGTTGGGKNGGAGSVGRIAIMAFQSTTDFGSSGTVTVGGTVTPAAGVSGAVWQPTIDETSQGVSKWFDLLGTNTAFQLPFWTDNVATLTGAPNNLVQGTDFDLVVELQGATGLNSLPDPTTAATLTPWTVHTSFATLNGKQYVRWRARFRVRRSGSLNPAVHPMPTIFDLTVPFQKV
ncbi:MAG: hypothetical protein U1E39_17945 [Planctomycetota bacterium]